MDGTSNGQPSETLENRRTIEDEFKLELPEIEVVKLDDDAVLLQCGTY